MSETDLPLYFEFTYFCKRYCMRYWTGGLWECTGLGNKYEAGTHASYSAKSILSYVRSGGWELDMTFFPEKSKTIPLKQAIAMVKADIEEPSIEITKKVVVKIKGVRYEAEGDEADKLVHLHAESQKLKDVVNALKKYEAK